MTDSRIKKVKFDGDALEVHLEGTDDDTERKTTVRSLGSIHPDLRIALQALEPHVRDILVLPDYWCSSSLRVTGVSFSHSEKTEVEGAVITCQADLTTCQSPFCFNTPHLPFEQYADEGDQPTMPVDAIEALETLKVEVRAYLDGKRAQGELAFGEAA